MEKAKIVDLLKDHPNKQDVEKFASYVEKLSIEKKDNKLKNYWLTKFKEEDVVNLFKRVANEGLVLDGDDVTLQGLYSKEINGYTIGVSYNYQAYKNKMLLAYPESMIDVQLVYQGDSFNFEKVSGKVEYSHKIANPFAQKDDDIIGAYCVIKNKRGEFLTTMSPEDIEKHRKVAKTDYIWEAWFKEMNLKTVVKKACGKHFKDTFKNIEAMDNDNYELDNPVDLNLKWKQEIDEINDIETLRSYWMENKGRGSAFDKYVTIRKNQLLSNNKEDANT